jgi:SM-20-related protein
VHAPPLPLNLTDADVRRLGEGGLVQREAAVPMALLLAAASLLGGLHAAGRLRPATAGKGHAVEPAERGDSIAWLDDEPPGEVRQSLHDHFESWRLELNRDAWLGLRRFEVQLSCYPGGGARYARHRDALPGGHNRVLTAILYLNPDWQPADGGMLRTWSPAGVVDFAPVGGHLALFLSERLMHEVLPAHGQRLAVTAWYRGAEEVPLLPDPESMPGPAEPRERPFTPRPGDAASSPRRTSA